MKNAAITGRGAIERVLVVECVEVQSEPSRIPQWQLLGQQLLDGEVNVPHLLKTTTLPWKPEQMRWRVSNGVMGLLGRSRQGLPF